MRILSLEDFIRALYKWAVGIPVLSIGLISVYKYDNYRPISLTSNVYINYNGIRYSVYKNISDQYNFKQYINS